jgi:hypothetical protein
MWDTNPLLTTLLFSSVFDELKSNKSGIRFIKTIPAGIKWMASLILSFEESLINERVYK